MGERKIPSDEEILAELPSAIQRSERAARTEPRAKSARYDRKSGRVVAELTNGYLFSFPAELGQGLRGASAEELEEVEVAPGGEGLHWEGLDADLLVARLVAGIFGSKAWMRELGRAGGSATSVAKARAARENGRKGGTTAPGGAEVGVGAFFVSGLGRRKRQLKQYLSRPSNLLACRVQDDRSRRP